LLKIEPVPMPDNWGAHEATQELNERLAFLTRGQAEVLLIDNDVKYPGTKCVTVVPSYRLATQFENQRVVVGVKKDGDPIYKTKYELWLKDPYRRDANGVCLRPGKPWGIDPATREFNLWWGWAVEPHEPDAKHHWRHFERHIRKIVANGDDRCATYILNWMAFCVQRPADLPEVALVFRGGEGAGKGTVAQVLGKFFGRHFLHLTASGMLTNRFNDEQKDKLLVFADENFYAGDHAAAANLKTMITEPTMRVETKFANAYTLPNYRKFIIASNASWVVPTGPDARRYAVFEVNEAHKQDGAYFKELNDELDDGGYEALLYDLLNRGLTEFDPRNFPQTRALFDQKRLAFNPVQEWWFDYLRSNTDKDWPKAPEKYLRRGPIQAAIELRCPGNLKRGLETQIGIELRKMCDVTERRATIKDPINTHAVREWVYHVPSLEECRRMFEEFVRTEINWETGEPKIKGDRYDGATPLGPPATAAKKRRTPK
jgi:Family of unknown function (DUF5906)